MAVALLAILLVQARSVPTTSQKLILTADDLGSGWSGTRPDNINDPSPGAIECAYVRLLFAESLLEGSCSLTIYSSQVDANAAYENYFENGFAESPNRDAPVNVTVGDRAVYVAYVNDSHEIWDLVLVMQKGRSIASIALLTYEGPSIEIAQIIELAEVQALKL